MSENVVFFDALRVVVLWMTPLVLIEGILLLLSRGEKYSKIEDALGKEVNTAVRK
jgi:hypothetical protein